MLVFEKEKWSPGKVFVLRSAGELFLLANQQSPSAEDVLWLERESFAIADARPKRALYLQLIFEGEGFQLPDDRAREAMAQFVRRAGVKFAAAAVVIEKHGFLSAALRSIFSGVLIAVKPPTPTKICASFDEASAFFREKFPGSFPTELDALSAEITRMRGLFPPSASR